MTKKDGGTRFCVDYRRFNDATVKDSYSLPRIDDTLDMLAGKQWFSTLDLANGYWQVSVVESKNQDSIRDTLHAISVQGHAIRPLQRTGHIRETDGQGPAGAPVVTLPSLPRWYYLISVYFWWCAGQFDLDVWETSIMDPTKCHLF